MIPFNAKEQRTQRAAEAEGVKGSAFLGVLCASAFNLHRSHNQGHNYDC